LNMMRIILFVVSILAASCQPGEIILTNLEQELIDSFSRVRTEALKQDIEDSCQAYRIQVIDYLVDSIKMARLNDIHRLLETK